MFVTTNSRSLIDKLLKQISIYLRPRSYFHIYKIMVCCTRVVETSSSNSSCHDPIFLSTVPEQFCTRTEIVFIPNNFKSFFTYLSSIEFQTFLLFEHLDLFLKNCLVGLTTLSTTPLLFYGC